MGLVFLSGGAPRSQFWRISSKLGTKMRKVAYKMGQDSVKMGVLGSTCEVLARSWLQLGRFWEVLGSILEAFWDIAIQRFGDISNIWEGLGSYVGRCFAELAPSSDQDSCFSAKSAILVANLPPSKARKLFQDRSRVQETGRYRNH